MTVFLHGYLVPIKKTTNEQKIRLGIQIDAKRFIYLYAYGMKGPENTTHKRPKPPKC